MAQSEELKRANAELRKATRRNVITIGKDGKHRDAQTGQYVGGMNEAVRARTGRIRLDPKDAAEGRE